MKSILLRLLGVVLAISFWSCEKDLMTYSGKEGVYFGVQWGPAHGDSTVWAYQQYTPVEFVKIVDVPSTTIHLRVMVTGEAKDYDRNFGVKVNTDSSDVVEGVDFEKLQASYSIRAGHLYFDMPITLKRTVDLQKIVSLNIKRIQVKT